MRNEKSIALVLMGMAVGCGVASVSPMAASWAAPTSGDWQCYQSDEFPDATKAANYKDAMRASKGMNAVAKHAPAGTITTFALDGSMNGSEPDLICVKY